MSGVLVREATEGDLPSITGIYNHYVRTSPATFDLAPVSLENRRLWMTQYPGGRHLLFVSTDGATVTGYATSGKVREKPGYLVSVETTVYVHPEHVGKGLGKSLYAAIFSALASEDVHRAYAAIVLPNPASIALHEHFGFKPAGLFREIGRKFDRYWDVQWFERTLP